MKENTRIELTQDQYDELSAIGVVDCEIKTIGCTMSIGGPSSDHHMTVGIKKRVSGGNHMLDNIDTTPIQVESLAGGAEWNGEGLPPVGTVCQYKDTNQWFNVEITYLSDWVIVFKCLDESGRLVTDIKGVELAKNVDEHPEFRKPETEAERNERERMEGIDAMYMTIADYSGSPVRNSDTWRDCEALYSAGYRKAVTNE